MKNKIERIAGSEVEISGSCHDEPDPFLAGMVGGPVLRKSASSTSISSQGSEIYWIKTKATTEAFFPSCTEQDNNIPTQIVSGGIANDFSGSTLLGSGEPSAIESSLGKRKADLFCNITSAASGTRDSRNVRPKICNDPDNPFISSHLEAGKRANLSDDSSIPVIIAYSPALQPFIRRRELSVGVQWEIARLVSLQKVKYEDVTIAMLDELGGSNSDAAPKVTRVLLPEVVQDERPQFVAAIRKETEAKAPWLELDREHAAFSSSVTDALGCRSGDSWYGGKVRFIGKLKDSNSSGRPQYTIELERPELGPSTRFTRRFGSAAFIRISVKKQLQGKKDVSKALIEYFRRPFILNGRVFRAFYAKDHNVFLKMTNEYIENHEVVSPRGDRDSPDGQSSLFNFLNWHNPMALNSTQTVAKWVARFALGLSNSVPGLELNADHIHKIGNIASSAFNGIGKLPSEMDMTDGCGFANNSLLRRLREVFEWEAFPTAVQCRLAGAKGLLLLHPSGRYSDSEIVPEAYVRPSQTKINYPSGQPLDRAMNIVDVLRTSKMVSPARLSAETIVNLAENGVPESAFIKLMSDGLEELVSSITTFDGKDAMPLLFSNVARAGGVMGMRMARTLGGEARAKGYGQIEDDKVDDDDDDGLQFDPALHQRSTAWWEDEVSGQPSTLEETVMTLLASGFHPRTCPVLAEKLEFVLERTIETFVQRYKISLPMSASAFIVPDPFGVLEPGEVHIKVAGTFSGSHSFIGQDGLPTDVIRGDVLVTRHPCKVPSDVQKVKAVEHEKLKQYTNVIIFSIKGKRSLASMLGGGDYDGDTVVAIWQPEIVNCFQNADPSFADPPNRLEEAFERNTETVAAFLERVPPANDTYLHIRELQKFLLSDLRDSFVVGAYSNMHDIAVYKLGYFAEETKRLAYMFCTCLDGSKTGLGVKPEILMKDKDLYAGDLKLEWKETPEEKKAAKDLRSEGSVVKRDMNMHAFIMDALHREGEAKGKIYMRSYRNDIERSINKNYDEDLAGPYLRAKREAEALSARGSDRSSLEEMSKELEEGTQGTEAQGSVEKLKLLVKGRLKELADGKSKELDEIVQHVKKVRILHRDSVTKSSPKKSKKGGAGFTGLRIETRQDMLRSLSKAFAAQPKDFLYFDQEQVRRVRASYAYFHDWEEQKGRFKHWTRFPWDVAMRDLCAIKAEASGFSRTITGEFFEKFDIASFVRNHR